MAGRNRGISNPNTTSSGSSGSGNPPSSETEVLSADGTRRRGVRPDLATPGVSTDIYHRRETDLGFVYFVRDDDPGWGYIFEDGMTLVGRYPIEYIEWKWGSGDTDPEETVPPETTVYQRELNATALSGRIAVVYGKTRIGGDIIDLEADSSDILWTAYSFGHGEIDSLTRAEDHDGNEIKTDNSSTVYGSYLKRTALYTGTTSQSADSNLAAAHGLSVGNMNRYIGIAYCVIRAEFNEEKNKSYPRPRFVVKGIKVLDPRLGVDGDGNPNQPAVWSDNPALCLADWLMNTSYGRGLGINGIDWDSVGDAADYCDTDIGGGEKRHTLNIAIMKPVQHKTITNMLRMHFRCGLINRGGKKAMVIDKAGASVFTFTEDNSRPIRLARRGSSEIANRVNVHYIDPSQDYNKVAQSASTSGVEAETSVIRQADYNLDGCHSRSEALRQAKYFLKKGQADLNVTLVGTTQSSLALEPYDIVTYTSASLGLTAQTLRIIRIQRDMFGNHTLDCEIYDASVYDDTQVTADTLPSISLPDPTQAPTDPTGLTLTAETFTSQEGRTRERMKIAWTNSTFKWLRGTRIYVQRTGYSQYLLGEFSSGPVFLDPIDDEGQYTITAKSVNRYTGVESTGASDTWTPASLAPPAPMLGSTSSGFFFDPPQTYTALGPYGGSYFSAIGTIPDFDASKVNDLDTGTLAATLDDTEGVKFDGTAAVAVRKISAWAYRASGAPVIGNLTLEWSDNDVDWTSAGDAEYGWYNWTVTDLGSDLFRFDFFILSNVGSHRYWRIKNASGVTWVLREVGFYSSEDYGFTTHYEVLGLGDKLFGTIQRGNEPTNVTPLLDIDIPAAGSATGFFSYNSYNAYTQVSGGGTKITIIPYAGHVSGTQTQRNIFWASSPATANGGNVSGDLNDYSWPDDLLPHLFLTMTGNTTLDGIAPTSGHVGGRVLYLDVAGAYTLTVTNDGGNTAANGIITKTGANLSLTGPCSLILIYNDSTSRFSVLSAWDANGIATGGASVAVTDQFVHGSTDGIEEGIPTKPEGAKFDQGSASGTSYSTHLNITGAGRLKMCAIGHNSNGSVTVEITIDGGTAREYTSGASNDTNGPFNYAVVGSVSTQEVGAGDYTVILNDDGEGMRFETSLLVRVKETTSVSGTAYVATRYELFQ